MCEIKLDHGADLSFYTTLPNPPGKLGCYRTLLWPKGGGLPTSEDVLPSTFVFLHICSLLPSLVLIGTV